MLYEDENYSTLEFYSYFGVKYIPKTHFGGKNSKTATNKGTKSE